MSALRERILGVPRGGDIVEQLRRLTAAGIEVHTQVVLCPGWNDGAHLDRTIDDLWSLGVGVASLSVVPVGLTRYNVDRPVRHLTRAEQRAAIAQLERARVRAQRERGTGWAYAADEMYLGAGLSVPSADYYDDWPLTENGVGSVRSLLDAFARGLPQLPRLDGRRIAIVTGTRMGEVMAPLVAPIERQTGARIELIPVENRLFGATVTCAGLLPGADMRDAVQARGRFDHVLIPAESLNDDDVFIDDMPLTTLRSSIGPARVLPAHELTAALVAAQAA